MLLDYCLSDIDPASPESLRQLAGLQLIPTLGGTLTALQLSSAPGARPLFLPTRQQQADLVNARDVLVACEVSNFHLDAEPLPFASGWVIPVRPFKPCRISLHVHALQKQMSQMISQRL